MRSYLLSCLMACCVIAIPWPAQAGAPDQDPPLSLQRAIALTLRHNPALQAAAYAAQAAERGVHRAIEKLTPEQQQRIQVIPLDGASDKVAIHAVCRETVFWETLEK